MAKQLLVQMASHLEAEAKAKLSYPWASSTPPGFTVSLAMHLFRDDASVSEE